MTRRIRATAALATAACLGAAAAASGTLGASRGAAPRVQGPAVVVPGALVRFVALGFRPGNSLGLTFVPLDHARCCAIRIPSAFLVSPSGRATLRFTMPRYYLRCPPWRGCKRIVWTRHEAARLIVAGYLEQAETILRVGR